MDQRKAFHTLGKGTTTDTAHHGMQLVAPLWGKKSHTAIILQHAHVQVARLSLNSISSLAYCFVLNLIASYPFYVFPSCIPLGS
jgi:hypothetical protein